MNKKSILAIAAIVALVAAIAVLLVFFPPANAKGPDSALVGTLPIIAHTGEYKAEVQQEEWRLFGECTITHYCPCEKCCGKSDGITASETVATAGRTVAIEGLPFGTKVRIGDRVYTVEDRGVSGMWVDIFCDTHEEALERGEYKADVYVLHAPAEPELLSEDALQSLAEWSTEEFAGFNAVISATVSDWQGEAALVYVTSDGYEHIWYSSAADCLKHGTPVTVYLRLT